MASASAASVLSNTARGSRHFTMALIWPLSPWPAPTTVFFTAFGAYSAIGSPSSAGTSSAMPRAWPSFSVAEASRLTKVCSMAASSGLSRANTSCKPSKIWRSREPRLSSSSETIAPQATKTSLTPSESITPQPVRRSPGSMPIMRMLAVLAVKAVAGSVFHSLCPTPAESLGDFATQRGCKRGIPGTEQRDFALGFPA